MRIRHHTSYTTSDGVQHYLLQSFLDITSHGESGMGIYEDETVKVIPVAMSKYGMTIKPGLVYDIRQGCLIGSTLKLDYHYIHQNPEPDIDILKQSMVNEVEVICLMTCDGRFGMPIGANHLPKGLNVNQTGDNMQNEACHAMTCLMHLKTHGIQSEKGVVVNSNVCSTSCICHACLSLGEVCAECAAAGIAMIDPSMRPCRHCLEKSAKCIKLCVLAISRL